MSTFTVYKLDISLLFTAVFMVIVFLMTFPLQCKGYTFVSFVVIVKRGKYTFHALLLSKGQENT